MSVAPVNVSFLGHRSLIKNEEQTAVINTIELAHVLIKMTLRMLLYIHFQRQALKF